MQETKIEQSTPEWHNFRSKGVGSSEIGTVMGMNQYKTCHQLWLEKTNQVKPEDLSKNFFIARGTALEPIARDIFNERTDSNFIPAVFIHKEFDFMRYSSDGVDFDKEEIIEIKCQMTKNHQKCIDEKKPSENYKLQMMWALMITEYKVCHFIAYNPEFPEPMFTMEIHPDEAVFAEMKKYAHWFWYCVTEMKDPDIYSVDLFISDNPGFI